MADTDTGVPELPKAVRKPTTAEIKAKSDIEAAKKAMDKATQDRRRDEKNVSRYKKKARHTRSAKLRARYLRHQRNCEKAVKSDKARYGRKKKAYDSAQAKYKRIVTDNTHAFNLQQITQAVSAKGAWDNEGKCAIYPSDGSDTRIIYISPSSAESETASTSVTTYPVDQGAPYSDYARVSSFTASISGIITGETRAEAQAKFEQLQDWNNRHTMLTYQGDFTYHNFIISELSRDFSDGFATNMKVSITFTYVYTAKITTVNGKHAKKSKSHKTTRGRRSKTYRAVTIRRGDTLWAFSKKYGKSVSWLARVNHIKNPNLIYPGRKIRVR